MSGTLLLPDGTLAGGFANQHMNFQTFLEAQTFCSLMFRASYFLPLGTFNLNTFNSITELCIDQIWVRPWTKAPEKRWTFALTSIY